MNYLLPVNPAPLTVSLDRPAISPVTSVADGANEFRDASKQNPSTYVHRGEVIEAIANDKRYRPQPNPQIGSQNQRAIATYQKVLSDPPLIGLLVDGYI